MRTSEKTARKREDGKEARERVRDGRFGERK